MVVKWFEPISDKSHFTINVSDHPNNYSIGFSRKLIDALKSGHVVVGYDDEKSQVIIKACNESETNALKISKYKNTSGAVNNKGLNKWLKNLGYVGKYRVQYVEGENHFVIGEKIVTEEV